MKRILLALDGGEPAQRALETAASLTRVYGAELAVVSVAPSAAPGDGDADQRARALLAARTRLAELGVDAEILEPTGDPATRIEQIAEEGGFDTIILGAPEAAALSAAIGGSVTNHVVTHASGVVVVTH